MHCWGDVEAFARGLGTGIRKPREGGKHNGDARGGSIPRNAGSWQTENDSSSPMISRLLRTWLLRTRWRSPTCSTSKSSSFMRKIRERTPKRYALRWTCSSAGSLPPGIRARRSEDRATLQESCGNIRRVERQSSDVGRLRRWFYRSKDPWPDRRAALRSLPGPILTYGPKASESLTG